MKLKIFLVLSNSTNSLPYFVNLSTETVPSSFAPFVRFMQFMANRNMVLAVSSLSQDSHIAPWAKTMPPSLAGDSVADELGITTCLHRNSPFGIRLPLTQPPRAALRCLTFNCPKFGFGMVLARRFRRRVTGTPHQTVATSYEIYFRRPLMDHYASSWFPPCPFRRSIFG